MASYNKITLIGNLGNDPEVKTFDNGKIASINLATTESYKDRNGERVDKTEWHRVEFRNKLAEIVETYLKKGSSILIEGRLTYDKYTDKDGNERIATKIKAIAMQMLSKKSDGNTPDVVVDDSDLPF